MLDIKFIRENPEKVKEACKNKNVDLNGLSVDWFINSEKEKRAIQSEIENLKAEQNRISRGGKENQALIGQAREIKEKIKNLEPKLSLLENELNGFLLSLPNIPFIKGCTESSISFFSFILFLKSIVNLNHLSFEI